MDEVTTVVGIDVGERYSYLNVLDFHSGEELERSRVMTRKESLRRWFRQRGRSRVILEVGTHSGWISRLLVSLGNDVLVADPRKARLLMGSEVKDDELDAELLARVGRLDPKLLKPVTLRGEQTQCALAVIRCRDALVRSRVLLINHVRGAVKALGHRLPSRSSYTFDRLESEIPEPLQDALGPAMATIREMTVQIRQLDQRIDAMCEQEYPQAERFQQIHGVGPITALTYVLTIEDPRRFGKSRQVGAYLGLVRKRWASGDDDPALHITKAGDSMLRRLLVQSAQYILGPFSQDSDLKRWGLKYAERGGPVAKRRAVVAVARRLAVLMHRLWVRGEDYEPLHQAQREQDVV